MSSNKLERRSKIRKSIRKKISGNGETPRIAVFRSNSAIYAQIIDDVKGHTLVAVSSKEVGTGNANIELSAQVGKKLAEKALNAGITNAIFDRGGYKYHGRVKALAEGAREGGLKI